MTGQDLDRALRELSAAHRGQEAPERVEQAVLAAFRARRRRRLRHPFVLAAAAAAALVFAWPLPVAEKGAGEIPLVLPSPPRPPELAYRRTPSAAEKAAAPRLAARPRRTTEAEIVSDFFALRVGPVLEPGEIGSVIRTRMPRWEMRRFAAGRDTFEGGSATVHADMLVGVDGTIRAIRFVQQ